MIDGKVGGWVGTCGCVRVRECVCVRQRERECVRVCVCTFVRAFNACVCDFFFSCALEKYGTSVCEGGRGRDL